MHTRLHQPVYDALATLVSVTNLRVSNIVFRDLKHIQSLVCALPHLTFLSLHHVTYELIPSAAGHVRLDKDVDYLATVRPWLSRLSVSPVTSRSPLPDVVAWLASGPSQESLKVLTLPHAASCCSDILSHFGPSVEYLSIPIEDMEDSIYGEDLRRYTSLRSFTVSIDLSDYAHSQWDMLVCLFERTIVADHLHTITIVFRLEHPLPKSLRQAFEWEALRRLEGALSSKTFSALRTVEILVLWADDWGRNTEAEVESLLRKIRRRLAELSTRKVLVTKHQVLQESGEIES